MNDQTIEVCGHAGRPHDATRGCGCACSACYDTELARYEADVANLVAAARYKFLLHRSKGKGGWENSSAWTDNDEPLERAVQEIEDEVAPASGPKRILELGDAINFLAFDYAINVRGRSDPK